MKTYIIAATLAGCVAAQAEYIDGNRLLKNCTMPPSTGRSASRWCRLGPII